MKQGMILGLGVASLATSLFIFFFGFAHLETAAHSGSMVAFLCDPLSRIERIDQSRIASQCEDLNGKVEAMATLLIKDGFLLILLSAGLALCGVFAVVRFHRLRRTSGNGI